jgi:hypothetical protein
MIDYTLILSRKYPGAQWILRGDDYDGLDWLDETAKPTKAELDAQWEIVLSDIEAEIASKKAAKESAQAKLGLTAEEIAALLS